MLTARSSAAVGVSGTNIIVAGGEFVKTHTVLMVKLIPLATVSSQVRQARKQQTLVKFSTLVLVYGLP